MRTGLLLGVAEEKVSCRVHTEHGQQNSLGHERRGGSKRRRVERETRRGLGEEEEPREHQKLGRKVQPQAVEGYSGDG